MDHVSGKWNIQILLAVTEGPVRFTELERTIPGISRRMLTLTLRGLERDGLITRTVYPTVPPKVEYNATVMAKELREPLEGLAEWARRNRPAIDAARASYDKQAHETGPA
jgi:DNA-binding HxlR family transcriptional regulator